ncbi:MAG: FAD-binding protein [Gammaproteobacteria bacterium]|nr:MAG: FAD-binding protein [Gammaproteobacteria bacterium]
MQFDHETGVLVVGSGNGALTAALSCYEYGETDVLVIEKASQYGGCSSLSGGGVWIPNNRYAKAEGADDSPADARAYLEATIPPVVPRVMLDTYIKEGPRMIDFLHERTRVRYESLAHYPDYYSDKPGARNGHRSLEPEPLNISDLGDEWKQLVQTHHMMYLFDRIAIQQKEAAVLVSRSPGWIGITFKLMLQYWLDLPWRLKDKRSRRITNGCAGIARLRLSMIDRNMPLWLNTAMTQLITDEQGRVIGAEVNRDGKTLRIRARKGVVLAAGGFEKNQAMRDQYLPKPTSTEWSAGWKGNTGDAIRAGLAVGAATSQMNGAWWCTTFSAPGEPLPRLAIMEKSLPGNVVVSRSGQRISNESQNYMAYQLALFARHNEQDPMVPAWMVFDRRFRRQYVVGPLLTADSNPDFMVPKEWYASGFLHKANTLQELANSAGIDENGLLKTVADMNEDAKTGNDRHFQRGAAAYDRYYGDPQVQPNPCLAPIVEPPFYAMRIDPGDFGTQGGLVIDTHARVLKEDGSAVEGLYAIGNCSAAVLPTYPGPGSTLGPAMTFGWLAARHITGQS